jgi:hypothetical protein
MPWHKAVQKVHECGKHQDKHGKLCSDACRRCAEEYRKMAV